MVVCAVAEAVVVLVCLTEQATPSAVQATGVLGSPLRRRVVSALIERDTLRRAELAEIVAADQVVPADDPERVEILLHHQHLPALEEAMIVEYDRRNGDVALWKDPDTAADLLDSA